MWLSSVNEIFELCMRTSPLDGLHRFEPLRKKASLFDSADPASVVMFALAESGSAPCIGQQQDDDIIEQFDEDMR